MSSRNISNHWCLVLIPQVELLVKRWNKQCSIVLTQKWPPILAADVNQGETREDGGTFISHAIRQLSDSLSKHIWAKFERSGKFLIFQSTRCFISHRHVAADPVLQCCMIRGAEQSTGHFRFHDYVLMVRKMIFVPRMKIISCQTEIQLDHPVFGRQGWC